jgi:anti-anti-sigma regulatory factor
MQIFSLHEMDLASIFEDIASIIKIKGEINLYSSQHIKECIENFVIKGKNIFFYRFE